MNTLRERLDVELARLSASYRNLVPTEQDRLVQDAIEEVLTAHFAEVLEAAKRRLSAMSGPAGKDDSWSW